MKYKIGDLVRIIPKDQWNKLPKDKDGDAFIHSGMKSIYFVKELSEVICGKLGEIVKTDCDNLLYYYSINFNSDYWLFHDD